MKPRARPNRKTGPVTRQALFVRRYYVALQAKRNETLCPNHQRDRHFPACSEDFDGCTFLELPVRGRPRGVKNGEGKHLPRQAPKLLSVKDLRLADELNTKPLTEKQLALRGEEAAAALGIWNPKQRKAVGNVLKRASE